MQDILQCPSGSWLTPSNNTYTIKRELLGTCAIKNAI
jgi:hypothetical protein